MEKPVTFGDDFDAESGLYDLDRWLELKLDVPDLSEKIERTIEAATKRVLRKHKTEIGDKLKECIRLAAESAKIHINSRNQPVIELVAAGTVATIEVPWDIDWTIESLEEIACDFECEHDRDINKLKALHKHLQEAAGKAAAAVERVEKKLKEWNDQGAG